MIDDAVFLRRVTDSCPRDFLPSCFQTTSFDMGLLTWLVKSNAVEQSCYLNNKIWQSFSYLYLSSLLWTQNILGRFSVGKMWNCNNFFMFRYLLLHNRSQQHSHYFQPEGWHYSVCQYASELWTLLQSCFLTWNNHRLTISCINSTERSHV